jgi:hypothetical protein
LKKCFITSFSILADIFPNIISIINRNRIFKARFSFGGAI